ncbi:hypothetical protein ACHAXA_001409 [Cyclostephanos tholiformis]|uniref:Potassium channel tetramerisation-type BTB domain-containing protein n=1 Tax=Cyclostephanos tholiformis TaxID=382380 RepID=A0ABD3R7C7_9STRA
MDKLHIASKSLNHAQLEYERDYNEQIFAFSQRESRLQDRMSQLISKKEEIAETNGNRDATDDDLVEVNAGGEIVVAKRSTLTQIQGTKFEAIFSGRWDKKLLRDSHGRIFLDVNPKCFRAIIDHLNEMLISSRDSPPSPPSVDGERKHLLQHQLDLFGIVPKVEIPESAILNDEGQCMVLFGFVPTVEMPNSTIIKHNGHCKILHDWLKEDCLDGSSSSFIKDPAMVYQVKRFTQTATTRAVLSPSSKRLVVESLGGIPTRPGRAAKIAMMSPTRLFCLHSPAAVFCLPAKC